MLKEFRNLTEYQALCLAERLDSAAAEAVLDGLRLEKLCAVLGSFALLTRLRVNRWLKELSKASPVAVTLRLESEEITPYMQESGVLCFGKKDLSRKEKLFMLLAHESAHFLLMGDERYPLLKEIDGEYKALFGRDHRMHSPVEECANLLTLLILSRCRGIKMSQNSRKIVERCIKTLKKQLTNETL